MGPFKPENVVISISGNGMKKNKEKEKKCNRNEAWEGRENEQATLEDRTGRGVLEKLRTGLRETESSGRRKNHGSATETGGSG